MLHAVAEKQKPDEVRILSIALTAKQGGPYPCEAAWSKSTLTAVYLLSSAS